MGKASRVKAERRRHRPTTAHIDVATRGMLEVLSVGKGDLKITLGPDPDDRAKAQRLIEDMLRAGYMIFVETDDGLERVRKFNPHRMTYVLMDVPDIGQPGIPAVVDVAAPQLAAPPALPAAEPEKPKRGRPRKAAAREVPVAGSRATAVGRTAGG
jgi:hypothetical protein